MIGLVVYKVTNKINKKIYIGKTTRDIKTRKTAYGYKWREATEEEIEALMVMEEGVE